MDVETNSLVRFAKNELDMLLESCGDKNSDSYVMQKDINEGILEVVKVFSGQEHSGFSAKYAIHILGKLLDYKPIQPLTGGDGEWNECGFDEIGESGGKKRIYQNRRCSAVFKTVDIDTGDSVATYNDKYIISDNGGMTWFRSRYVLKQLGLSENISFPFIVPVDSKRIYIKYLEDVQPGETSEHFVDITNDPDAISELRAVSEKKFHAVEK